MKISVLIPAYNEQGYIAQTLGAVTAQDYGDFEIIVIDNNSSDGTVSEVAKFSNVRLIHEPRQGVQYARERGRREAVGDIIANLDADCIPGPHWLQEAAGYFDSGDVVAVSGPYYFSDAPRPFQITSAFIQRMLFPVVNRVFYALFRRGVITMGGNTFIRSTALAAIGGYNTTIVFYGDDIDTGNRLARLGKVLYERDIEVKTSARRFKSQGILGVQGKYILNYFWIIFFGKPYDNVSVAHPRS